MSRHDTLLAHRAAARWADEQRLGEYYQLLVGRLDSLYALKLPPAANDSGRAAIAHWSRDTLVLGFGPAMKTYSVGQGQERPINNAALIGVKLYRTNLDLFDKWGHKNGDKIEFAVEKLRNLVKDDQGAQAFATMKAYLETLQ